MIARDELIVGDRLVVSVVGARPNFVKMAPVIAALDRRGIAQVTVHTGQHYDARMSAVFFDELGMPEPGISLGVGSGSHAEQTARVMLAFEPVLVEHRPDLVVVAGDVNSTLACALTATKLDIPVAHVESGLRSFDRTMPEEVNRILTDHISDLLFVTEPSGAANLRKEGIDPDKIHFTGNTMIDSLDRHLPAALARAPWAAYGLEPGSYAVLTLHRPANVDEETKLRELLAAVAEIGAHTPVLFPAHPRTQERMDGWGLAQAGVRLVEPLGYLDFLGLMARARLVLTDSGGVQEETTALGVPCLTIRDNTERPVTIEQGSNQLAGTTGAGLLAAYAGLKAAPDPAQRPHLWDGHAAERIADVLTDWTRGR
ncbi:MAG TPA: UDP-N-acetylglucosamine 2-epimerase (non-hydrolyzing) [Anaerolineales bacterium]|nr:UDP-N-acetylglucosamine 2-epimerase (non-hydrolyzing) [Anaerolineales bacterium]